MQSEAQQHQLMAATTPPSGGELSQFSQADIERWKAKYMAVPPPRRIGGSGMDSKTIQIGIIAVASAIALPATAFIIASAVPSAQNERMVHHLLQQNAELASQQRKICVLAYCPPDKPAATPATVPPVAPAPEYVQQEPITTYQWETPQQSTVTLADGTVVEIPGGQ